MIVEIARFRVPEDAEQEMLAERPAMVEAMRRRYPSYRDAYLTRLDDGVWVDVVLWGDRAEAEGAAEGAYAFPEIATWLAHTTEVIGFEYAEVHDASLLPRAGGEATL
jgi:hypothetical protein